MNLRSLQHDELDANEFADFAHPASPERTRMKGTDIVWIKPFTVRPETAAALFEAPHLLQDMVKAGWVTPCYKTNRCTLYLVSDLEKCADRLSQGETPVIISR
jgi:hypothetical protein